MTNKEWIETSLTNPILLGTTDAMRIDGKVVFAFVVEINQHQGILHFFQIGETFQDACKQLAKDLESLGFIEMVIRISTSFVPCEEFLRETENKVVMFSKPQLES